MSLSSGPIPPRVFELLAALLEYPTAGAAGAARECERLAGPLGPEIAAPLREFGRFACATPLHRLQEVYTRTFDLDATYHPYVGHHLFGESYKRSVFMLGLKERYDNDGFHPDERELPDHVAVILRYLAACRDEETAGELIHLALLPALERMTKPKDDRGTDGPRDGGYVVLLDALRLTLDRWPRPAEDVASATTGGRAQEQEGGATNA